ncbi:MAG: argininosuccinate lyase [Myxococcales bacterium]|nr:argininosuccinate lyase [Myxococcales bacterium]
MSTNQHAWGGRFSQSPAAALDAINKSIAFDLRLWPHDIAGSLAHARGLRRIGVIDAAALEAIERGLAAVETELRDGTFEVRSEDEDVHMAVERRLTELVGDPGRRLHTGRSRNDQVATDVRLFVRSACDDVDARLRTLCVALADAAATHAAAPLPAYTHLQRGMPTTLGHHLLAYFEMFDRDRERVAQCRARANVSPLGSGACVGSSFPLDRAGVASDLGFAAITRNSLDAVSDRDFVADFLFAASMVATHLSRLGEELVLWSTSEFGFVELGDSVTTGSSMMPNKKNPDGAELMRGKAGRVFGDLVGFLATLKGLPLTYNKDMQEDKEPLFDAFDTIVLGLDMAVANIEGARFRTDRMRAACSAWVNATDLCESLVRAGEPLRTAHHQTGRLVRLAVERGVEIEALPLEVVQEQAPMATAAMLEALALQSILDIKTVAGGTAPASVAVAAAAARERATAAR